MNTIEQIMNQNDENGNNIYQYYRNLAAITDSKQLYLGTFYTNNHNHRCIEILRILTKGESYRYHNLPEIGNTVETIVDSWSIYELHCYNPNKQEMLNIFLYDYGIDIDKPYTPWLIFEEREPAKFCREDLTNKYLDQIYEYNNLESVKIAEMIVHNNTTAKDFKIKNK